MKLSPNIFLQIKTTNTIDGKTCCPHQFLESEFFHIMVEKASALRYDKMDNSF